MPKTNHTPKTLREIARGAFTLPAPADGSDNFLPKELAKALHVSVRTMQRWCRAGRLKTVERCGYVTIPVREAQRFVVEGRNAEP